jgi:hypothetical protein
MPTQVTIIEAVALPSFQRARMGKMDRVVRFKTEAGHTGQVIVPDELASHEAVSLAIAKELTTRSALVGKTITIP